VTCHEGDRGLVAHGRAIERLAGLRITRLEQHTDDRRLAARQALFAQLNDVSRHAVDALGLPAHRAGLKARQPIGQPQHVRKIEVPDLPLIGGERGDDLARMLGAQARAENRATDDLRGQRRHLVQRIDPRPRRQRRPALGGFVRGLDHGRGEQREARGVRDRCHDAPALLP
jgi:hypothetical protein